MTPQISVLLLTYNHEKYISQAINSVLNQITNFGYEILIGDDCSTDKTSEIVEEFAEKNQAKIKLIRSKENVGSIQNEKRLFEAAKGKYIAFLEGDDFWTDPYKLQKQFDFLESNPEYGLVHGDVNHYNEKENKTYFSYNRSNGIKISDGMIFEKIIIPSHIIKTMTTCFRRDLVERFFDYNVAIERSWALTDLPLWIDISKHSKVKYFDEVLATYRLRLESASRSSELIKQFKFQESVFDVFDHYTQKYHCSKEIVKAIDKYKFAKSLRYSLILNNIEIIKKYFIKSGNISLKKKLVKIILCNKCFFSITSATYRFHKS
jgi:glycosyltransferase involved in cell wall biosynthesis